MGLRWPRLLLCGLRAAARRAAVALMPVGETRSRGSLLDRQSRESDDLAVHMHALEDRAGGVPVRCFAWPSGRLADATSSTAGCRPVRQRVRCPRGLSLGL